MRWKWLLLSACALTTLLMIACALDDFGFDGSAWYGWWDGNYLASRQPFVATFDHPEAGGATARAGIRAGDWVDLREQSFRARIWLAAQPLAGAPFDIVIHRGNHRFVAHVDATTMWQVDSTAKNLTVDVGLLATAWFIVCAVLIAVRRSNLFEARVLTFILLCQAIASTGLGNAIVAPSPTLTLALFILPQLCGLVSMALLVALSSHFGIRTPSRRIAEWIAYAVIAAAVLDLAMFVFAMLTLRFDPLPVGWLNFNFSPLTQTLIVLPAISVAVTAGLMVAKTDQAERARATWLIVPLAAATLLIALIYNVISPIETSWAENQAFVQSANVCSLLAALAVTYAVLKRRVLDLEFVLSRTLVVASISIIVVVAFILLEWILGSVLSGVSRNTGIVANALLALLLGLSLRYMHMRVDAVIDAMLFRKRHADERALLDFAKEATYATDWSALLDTAIGKIKRHTDARSAALLVEENRAYAMTRSYGNGELRAVDENDAAILALKAAHEPIDPHHYDTALAGAIAVPMLSRGRVLGIVLLGERVGNEAYAPDEVEALSQFAHGVGSALDLLSTKESDALDALRETITNGLAMLNESIRALPESIAQRLRGEIE